MPEYILNEDQEAWLNELETTDKPQGNGYLNRDGKYCCLGIACELFGIQKEVTEDINPVDIVSYNNQISIAPDVIVRRLKLRSKTGAAKYSPWSLTALNDNDRSFKQIAELVRKDPGEYFV